ncbi:MAG: hypothetical protein Unbinned5858contig1001_44 [Prokaryotic dsDNA virus sp.]|nr:MAG: hypothetical protein Unbinned5858contig1001_44 [Prokaryotic dsDNA virus sp.]|tara:strand:- start:227 stop:1150 length:924 start_codon:yes stop_codon:yes gene_type:complete
MRGIIQYVRRGLLTAINQSPIWKFVSDNLIEDSGIIDPTNNWVATGDFSFVAGRGAFFYADSQEGMIRPEDQFFQNFITKGQYYVLSFKVENLQTNGLAFINPTNINKDVVNEFGNNNYLTFDAPNGRLIEEGYNAVLLKIPLGGSYVQNFAIYSTTSATNGFFIDNIQLHKVDPNMIKPLRIYNRVIPKPVFPFIHIYSDTQEETLNNQQNPINEVVTKIEVVDRVIGSGGGELVLNNIVGQITYALKVNLNTWFRQQNNNFTTDFNNINNTEITNIAVKYFQDADEDHYYFRAIISVTNVVEEIN